MNQPCVGAPGVTRLDYQRVQLGDLFSTEKSLGDHHVLRRHTLQPLLARVAILEDIPQRRF